MGGAQEQGRSPAGTFSFLAVAPGEAVPGSGRPAVDAAFMEAPLSIQAKI